MANTSTTTKTARAPQRKGAQQAKGAAKGATTGKRSNAAQQAQAAATQVPNYGLRAAPTTHGQRRTAYAEAALVRLMVQHNPKRPGTGAWNRFAQYQSLAAKHGNGAFTVQMVLDAGVQPSDIRYNVKHGFIVLEEPK